MSCCGLSKERVIGKLNEFVDRNKLKLCMGVHAYLSTWEAEAGGL